jgi:exopolysaccharide production protein ExoZ
MVEFSCSAPAPASRCGTRQQRRPSAEKAGFLPRIESMRGIAALAVVGYHVANQLTDLPRSGPVDVFAYKAFMSASNGTGAVVAFFVLSGFVLARSLASNPDPARYFRSRFFRLFPAAVAVVGLLAALHSLFEIHVGFLASFDPVNIVLNMLMIRSDINSPMWSMTVECFATPLILFSVLLCRRHGARPLQAIILILFGLSFWGPYVHALGGATSLAALYAFVVGVLVHRYGERIAAAVDPGWAELAGPLTILIYCICGAKKQTAPILMVECLAMAMLVVLLVWRPACKLFRPLDLNLVRFYGRISYSLYLLHPLGMLFSFRLLARLDLNHSHLPASAVAVLTTLASVALMTPFAYLSWRFIEIPFIALGRRARVAPATAFDPT